MLAAETGLPRPTLVRLLQTLIALGYASRVSRQAGYRLTDHVLALAGGVRFIDHLVDAAIPHMSRFTAEHGWPLYLATLSSGAMAIRHSTAPESPMSFETAGYNRRSPMLVGALGRVWFAFCSDEERRTILRGIGARERPALAALLDGIRRDGFAFTRPPRPTRIHGIGRALPSCRGLRGDRLARGQALSTAVRRGSPGSESAHCRGASPAIAGTAPGLALRHARLSLG